MNDKRWYINLSWYTIFSTLFSLHLFANVIKYTMFMRFYYQMCKIYVPSVQNICFITSNALQLIMNNIHLLCRASVISNVHRLALPPQTTRPFSSDDLSWMNHESGLASSRNLTTCCFYRINLFGPPPSYDSNQTHTYTQSATDTPPRQHPTWDSGSTICWFYLTRYLLSK